MNSPLTRLATAVLPLALVVTLAACSGDDANDGDKDGATPSEVLNGAAQRLAGTSGAHFTLETSSFPDGTTGVVGAEGDITSAPAFDGTLTVRLSGTDFQVPVIGVDDKVWAQIPLTKGWSDIDPADYGAPDPSRLLGAEHGVGALLTATEDVERGKTVRGGENNRERLTTYSGTVDGDTMQDVIPSSTGDTFDVVYRIDSDGDLSEVDMTGVFYPDTDEMTYRLEVTDLGLERTITAP